MSGLVLLFVWSSFAPWPDARAQDLVRQRHPFSTYLDLRPVASEVSVQTTPPWVESVEFTPGVTSLSVPEVIGDSAVSRAAQGRSAFRIRLQTPADRPSDSLQARVFFQDSATNQRPTISAWNELGERVLAPVPLGQNLGLASAETFTLPMKGVDYLEIETEGDGSQVRGVFLSWLEATEVLQPSDFRSRENVRQPFQISSAARRSKNDAYLYGTVTASLYTGSPLVLRPREPPPAPLQFELERPPLVAVVTCEILGASLDAAPNITINGHPEGNLSLHLPDLADPAYQGLVRETGKNLGFRYTGWISAQKLIPGDRLKAGLNDLGIVLSNATDAVAVRSVSIQLKYNWEKLDYVLAPSPSAP